MVSLTEKAADYLKKVQSSNNAEGKALRIAVVDGGCSGLKYQLGFDEKQESDELYSSSGLNIVVDPQSLTHIDGIEIDQVEGIDGSQLVFNNPNQTGGCGCGKSFC